MGTYTRRWRALCGLGALAALAACTTVNQGAFSNYVAQTVQPGMTLDEALVRMRAEGFSCNASTGGSVTVCTRPLERMLRTDCVERVDLVRSVNAVKLVGKVDVLETRCAKLWN
ncbi:hypothetical protein GTP23_04545 [Pseudoduganella sp. FT93W]|uniref:Lipoprotein n=1 Tax=Duganella fentianensis TaxID=2692177 RepID=A0A845HTI9_9BURK|nr:hypothetical protein [Duganella fentianensis]MYN44340.1 hypothetical protein [Duganella fentianensis]